MDTTSQIIVHESNLDILAIAMYYMNLKNIWKEKRIQIIYDKDYVLFRKNMVRCTPVIHYPSLETLENLEVKEILKNYFIQITQSTTVDMMLNTYNYMAQNCEYIIYTTTVQKLKILTKNKKKKRGS